MKPVTLEQALAVSAILATNIDWSQLDGDDLQGNVVTKPVEAGKKITEFIKNGLKTIANFVFTLIADIERDMTGWERLSRFEAEPGEFVSELEEFLQESDDGSVDGEEMIRRAEKRGIQSSLRHAEALRRDQDKIPVAWRKFVLVFTEVWRSPHGDRHVWYLYWDGEQWCLYCYWLSFSFDSDCRLVRPRKYQKSLVA